MNEFELIDRYFRRAGGSGVRLGIGDDAAILELPPGRQLVCAVDTLVESVHFPAGFAAADIGYRALAINLSDIAAMGATPAWMTLALTVPAADSGWLEKFADGLFEAADLYGVALVGGDTTRGEQVVVSVQLIGHVAPEAWMSRGGCQPGDRIYVTGTPGDAAAGLGLIKGGRRKGPLVDRFRRPTPRVAFGLAAARLASAAIDLSDGLYADLGRLLRASGVGASIERQTLPLSRALIDHLGDDAAWQMALSGGDDYELCLTVAPAQEQALIAAARQSGVRVSCIGRAEADTGMRLTAGGQEISFAHAGYRHF